MNDKLDGVATFVQVVEAGSFALAAERLNLTRSAVGKAITRLETRLGVRLLHRSTRSQTLTTEGQCYYERCVRALAELDDAEASFDISRVEPGGRLRVSAPMVFGHVVLSRIAPTYAQAYPQVELEIVAEDRLVDPVQDAFDLVIRVNPPQDALLVGRRIATDRRVLVAAPGLALPALGAPRDPDAPLAMPAVIMSNAAGQTLWPVELADGRPCTIAPQPVL
ncbi:MAG: LysR family transcriptional regulator, partial [Paraburkholderia tropica]